MLSHGYPPSEARRRSRSLERCGSSTEEAFGDASIKTWIFGHTTFSFCAGRGGAMRGGGAKAGKGNNL